jgi:membrane-associated phospholipid phosphatase
MKKTLATIVSRILDPFVVLTILLIVAFAKSSLTTLQQIQWFIITGLAMIGIPLGLFVWALHKGKIKNWDISDRGERPKLFLLMLLYETLLLFIVRSLMDAFLFQTFLTVIIAFAGFSFITLFWKISGHAFVNALAAGLIIQWFGWGWWSILCIVPLVSWSRVVRGDHTIAQVVAGSAYAFSLVYLFSFVRI